MKYLLDTNIFLHTINSNIYSVAKKCKDNGKNICITETILQEIEPSYNNFSKESREIYTSVNNLVTGKFGDELIEIIKIGDIPGAKEILKKIRDRHYRWMTDTKYLNKLIEQGKITREYVKSERFRRKDLGECELVAIAKATKGNYVVVSNDKGKVFLHPDLNVYDIVKDDPKVRILNGEEWKKEIGYK